MIRPKSVFVGMSKVAVVLIALSALTTAAGAATKTLDNMQTAFSGESNAHARYLAFAKQADDEGYGEAASLFRAAARAEEIHAGNHAAVMKGMGAVPQSKIDTPEVKSTRENLETAMKGETYERDTMYPEFVRHLVHEFGVHAISPQTSHPPGPSPAAQSASEREKVDQD